MTIRKRTKGWQVIVYAGLDPLTGKQRQITRQVNGSYCQAEKVEARVLDAFYDDLRRYGNAKAAPRWSAPTRGNSRGDLDRGRRSA